MKKKINYLGLLSLLSLLTIFGLVTKNKGFYGFIGFIAYARYFYVEPDELFELNLRKACTLAYLIQLVSLVPLTFAAYILRLPMQVLLISFVLSFFVFTFKLVYLEWEEGKNTLAKNENA